MSYTPISAVIITYNEAHTIGRCIDALMAVVDEIVVIDSYSSDRTKAICLEKKVRFLQREWQGYTDTKNFGNSIASHDYILSIDADEVLSDALRTTLLSLKQERMKDAYRVNRRTNYCGHWVKYCGWHPDWKLRLWDKKKGQWEGIIHETVTTSGFEDIHDLAGELLHYSFPTIASHVRTANNFSEIAAREAFEKGKKAHLVLHVLLNPLYTFFNKYFLRAGFRDGYYGFIICWISGFANFLKYTKIRQLHKEHEKTKP